MILTENRNEKNMYVSRLFATNGIVSLEFDALNGVVFVNDEERHLNIPRYLQIQEDLSLKPTINVVQGEDWQEDRLILPIISGCQIVNPSEILAEPPVLTTWKWQEYLHINNMGNRCGIKDDIAACAQDEPRSPVV